MTRLINNAMESDFGMRQTDDLNSYICDQLLALDTNLDRDVFIRVLNIIYHHILQSFLDVIEQEVQVPKYWPLQILLSKHLIYY